MSKPENDLQGYPAEFTEFMSGKCRAQVRRFVAVALRVRKAGKGFREFRRQIGNYAKKYGRKFYWLWTSAITYARLKKAGLPVQKSKPLSPEQQQIRRDVLKQADKVLKYIWRSTEKLTDHEPMVVDLHGYRVCEALEVADNAIQEAFDKGLPEITLIHGAPDVRCKEHALILGRGGIKWELRSRLAQGYYMDFVYNRRSTKHRIGDASMTLALRPKLPVELAS
jgi:hypothetical protein